MYRAVAYFVIIAQCFRWVDSSPPRDVRISPIGPGYVRVEWDPPQGHNAVTGYQILYTEDVNLPDRKWRKVVAQDGMLVLKGLTEGKYFFKIKAVFDGSIIGQASDVQELNVIKGDGSEMLPKITKVEQGTRPSIAYVYWTKPDYLDGRLLKYELYYGQTPLSKSAAKLTVDQLNYENFEEVDRYMVKVMNLLYDTKYDFMVKVVTKDNLNGVDSKIHKFRTNPKPSPKQISKPRSTRTRDFWKNVIQFILDIPSIAMTYWLQAFILLTPVWFLVWNWWYKPTILVANDNFIPRLQRARISYQQATKFYEEENYREALDAYKDLINCGVEQFDLVEIYYRMAVCCEALNELEECLTYCSVAIFYDLNKVEALVLKGKALTRLGRFDQAYLAYQAAFLIHPSEENWRFLRDAQDRLNQGGEQDERNNNREQPTRAEHFRILGLAEGATNPQIKQAYIRETRKYHPDKNRNATSQQVEELNRRTQLIREAYKALYTN